MINNPKDSVNFPLKQDGLLSSNHHHGKAKAPPPPSPSSSQWLRLKDPRIVRVSRAFGGKDRHSKVCTIRGLRDRRVRLSVPTAINLYDLQDRLGLSQPSKVVDWLLNAAKHDIDELPPLPAVVLNNNFTLGFPSLVGTSHRHHNNDVSDSISKPKSSKEVFSGEEMVNDEEEKDNDKEGEGGGSSSGNSVLVPSSRPNNFIPSFLGLVNSMPFGYQWDQNSSSSSTGDVAAAAQLGNHQNHNGFSDHMHSINVVSFPSNLGGSQRLVCPPPDGAITTTTTQSYFPSHNNNIAAAAMEMDPRQMINSHYHQLLMNSVINNPSHHQHHHRMMTRMTPKLFHSTNTSSESQSQHKDQDFPSK